MDPFSDPDFKPHPLDWVVAKLRQQISYIEKSMFGCRACYMHGDLVLVLAAQDEEPWDGVLVATHKEAQASLIEDLPALVSHPVLGKWLYISQKDERFEEAVEKIADLIVTKDKRIGVPPSKKGRKKSKTKKTKKSSKK